MSRFIMGLAVGSAIISLIHLPIDSSLRSSVAKSIETTRQFEQAYNRMHQAFLDMQRANMTNEDNVRDCVADLRRLIR